MSTTNSDLPRFELYLNNMPPCLVRLFAMHKRKGSMPVGMTTEDIAVRSKGALSVSDVSRIEVLKSWDEVKVKDMIAFCEACNLKPWITLHRNKVNTYLKQPKSSFAFLKKAGTFQKLTKNLHS